MLVLAATDYLGLVERQFPCIASWPNLPLQSQTMG